MVNKLKNFFVRTAKVQSKREEKPIDIYYNSLEEAYGNLPVPADDWAGVEELLNEFFNQITPDQKEKVKEEFDDMQTWDITEHLQDLESAIEFIRKHYFLMSIVLNKSQRWG
jgi:hypothetical protein